MLTFHRDKTRQDRLPVSQRPRVLEANERRAAMSPAIDATRRMSVQLPRIRSGRFALRHLNCYIRNRGVATKVVTA